MAGSKKNMAMKEKDTLEKAGETMSNPNSGPEDASGLQDALNCCGTRQKEAPGQDDASGPEGALNCCGTRHKERSPEEIKSLVNRLNRIEGQVRGIRKMVESGAYCPDILTQSAAVSAAMNAFNKQLLASHVHSCVVEDIRSGREETVDELCSLLQKLMK